MLAALLLYGGLAGLALWATVRDPDLRWIGLWLVGGFIISNALFFLHVRAKDSVGPYTFIEIMVAVAAAWALAKHTRWLILILVFNLLSIAANFGLSIIHSPSPYQIYMWRVATNVCFAAECLVAIGAGIADGLRTGRFDRWPRLRRWSAQLGSIKGRADS